MTRPQGNIFANGKCYEAGRGKIGYTILHSLNELTPEAILEATIFNDQFILEEWGGCNQLFLLDDGNVGILSHIARFDEAGNRHYYSFVIAVFTSDKSALLFIGILYESTDR